MNKQEIINKIKAALSSGDDLQVYPKKLIQN